MVPGLSRDITVCPATDDDVEFLVEVILQANIERYRQYPDWDEGASVEWARRTTSEQIRGKVVGSTTYVIEFAGERVGRLRVVRSGEQLEIAGIQLLPAFQRRGIGTFVIRMLLHEGEGRGVPVVLEVEHDNPLARSLYLRLGFEPLAETVDHTRMIFQHGR